MLTGLVLSPVKTVVKWLECSLMKQKSVCTQPTQPEAVKTLSPTSLQESAVSTRLALKLARGSPHPSCVSFSPAKQEIQEALETREIL